LLDQLGYGAFVKGVSTRKVDDVVKAHGISCTRCRLGSLGSASHSTRRSARSSLAQIEGEHPYVWLDATFHKVLQTGRVISVATVVAIGVNDQEQRTTLGVATGQSEDHQFWTSFLRSLIKRGLKGGLSRQLRCRGTAAGDRQDPRGLDMGALPGALHAEPCY
jgi:putative transposase